MECFKYQGLRNKVQALFSIAVLCIGYMTQRGNLVKSKIIINKYHFVVIIIIILCDPKGRAIVAALSVCPYVHILGYHSKTTILGINKKLCRYISY